MNNSQLAERLSVTMGAVALRSLLVVGSLIGVMLFAGTGLARESVNPLTREYVITVDPTAIQPPTWWHVPGITPLIWTNDPITYESHKTTVAREITLKPGEYRFGTFTFDFAFRVTLDGTLDFADSLTQCVDGRGTQTLVIRCSHTQPYKQERDYDYADE